MSFPRATIEVFACDADLNIVAPIKKFISLNAQKVLNDVGSWEIQLSAESAAARWFDPVVNPAGGILIRRNGQYFLAGPQGSDTEEWSSDGNRNEVLTFSGTDHNIWLFSRDIYPNPALAVGAQDKQLYQITTAAAVEDLMIELVRRNLGDLALAPRQLEHLTFATSLNRGIERKSDKYRFNKLGLALQTLCNDAVDDDDPTPLFTRLSFDLVQNNSNELVFTVSVANKANLVQFSRNLKTVQSYQLTRSAPTGSVLVLGAGLEQLRDEFGDPIEGAQRFAKGLFEYSRTDTVYPRRIEDFVDVGLLNPADEDFDTPLELIEHQLALDKAAADAFQASQGQIGATVVPKDTNAQQYGRDYQLGDFCTVRTRRTSFVEQIREVHLDYSSSNKGELTISVGTAEGDYARRTSGPQRRITSLKDYMNRLKREK